MGRGAALGGDGPSAAQPPRLTGVLRALTTDHGAAFDADQAFLRRQAALKSRQLLGGRGAGGGGAPLLQELLGQKAPKAARDDYDRFVAAVRGLIGGDPPSAELAEAAAAAWRAVGRGGGGAGLAPPEELKLHKTGPLLARQLAPYEAALRAALQHVEPGAVARVLEAAAKLRGWRAQLGLADVGAAAAGAAGKGAVFAAGAGKQQQKQQQQQLMDQEWGSDLPFVSPDGAPAARGAEAYARALLGGGSGGGAGPAAGGGGAAGVGGAKATPGELLEMYAAGMGGGRPAAAAAGEVDGDAALAAALAAEEAGGYGGHGGAGGAYGGAADEEVEIDSDDERRKGRKAGVLWLERWCKSVGGAESVDHLGTAAASLLLSDAASSAASASSDDHLAAQIMDLLGDAGFEATQQLMERRRELVDSLREALAKLRASTSFGDDGEPAPSGAPSIVTGVTITSESQKILKRLERKAARKGARAGGAGGGGLPSADADLELLSELGFGALVDQARPPREAGLTLGGVTFSIGDAGTGAKNSLPKGTTRKNFKGYEEVLVPPATALPPPAPGELVAIDSLPAWCRAAFPGYKTLNRIQSRIYTAAFTSNENLLVCAPTGAGKTNIAMITVLREIGANRDERSGWIDKGAFKIVYVAPMKALAAEVTSNFGKRLAPLGLSVRELTGDMQLSKRELAETQMIVTTPEKWDVITRKGGDVSIASLVKLLIIDEVHLLNDDRGPVIETLIARTLRQVEASQSMIRIVGLSATLPNYKDVANFLGVTPSGLFFFGPEFRPVPLEMEFLGVSVTNLQARTNLMNEICYNKVVDALKRGKQVMVFVHSRKETGKTGRVLAELAAKNGEEALFLGDDHPQYGMALKDVRRSRNRELGELFDSGMGLHHAGMLRSDRNLTERMFSDGIIKVLCCTATLAWGVNLPAHTVVIKGTQVYDAQRGQFADLGVLDVQQIFGRAGRPQFDSSGRGIIITTHNKLPHYLGMLMSQVPIESKFQEMLVDNLNAELVLGTVTNVKEAIAWLKYTYLYGRMTKNPLAYGITWETLATDPTLEVHCRELITAAARVLHSSKMAVFEERSGNMFVTELGRVASHYYIRAPSIVIFNERLKPHLTEADVLAMMALSSEFDSMAVREEEGPELEDLLRGVCPFDIAGGADNKANKANVLIQAYTSRARVEGFSLVADMMYVAQNAPRIARALFEICLRRKWSSAAATLLEMCKALELRLWPHQHPLRQFETALTQELLSKLEDRRLSLDMLADMSASEIGAMVRHPSAGEKIKACVDAFPYLLLDASLQPITRTVLRISLTITPAFEWREKAHGQGLRWWVWVEDTDSEHLYHSESWLLTRKMAREGPQKLAFTIPIHEPLPPQYYVRVVSDSWLQAESYHELSFKGLVLPQRMPPHTELLDLDPLPLGALRNPALEALYTGRFTHFNPIQTQAFHTLYHTDENVLLGAPTGSGKTISSELTMFRLWAAHPGDKVIYIAPLKALVRERMSDWGKGLCARLGKKMVELTGDYTPDLRALLAADIIIATPEKWDGISRNWQTRGYVRKVGLIIIDEIHLLGADRGPILEVIVSRMRYVAAEVGRSVRFVGLSTALANAQDLADWLGIGPKGLFNFKPSVRPVPLEAHIQGYPGKFYCPRMASMNKPAYAAIQVHSPLKPVLVFVSSRRQTRLTALDLITFAAADERPEQWLHMEPQELQAALAEVRDPQLRHTLQFGIGLHHAGLSEGDRGLVERLYNAQKIQILVATSTLAWGVNTPAHLVIIKGTEFYDAPLKKYTDFPITDVLQMMGRAGRPQYDKQGFAVIMVAEAKKQFYKRFLYEPFPVESSLRDQLPDHINAEVVGGTVASKQDALDYLTWTYFYRRLMQNPSYYDLDDVTPEGVSAYLSQLVEDVLRALEEDGCVELDEDDDGGTVSPTPLGRVASFYYLHHATAGLLARAFRGRDLSHQQVLEVLCACSEYDELPVRHNEDRINAELSKEVRWPLESFGRGANKNPGMPGGKRLGGYDDPHAKAALLLQCHLGRLPPPISDYATDTKSALDNSVRICQALVDVAADSGALGTALATMELIQGLVQARWMDGPSLATLPNVGASEARQLAGMGYASLPQLLHALRGGGGGGGQQQQRQGHGQHGQQAQQGERRRALQALEKALGGQQAAAEAAAVCDRLPLCAVAWRPPRPLPRKRRASAGGGGGDAEHEEEGADGEEQLLLEVELTRSGGGGRGGGGTAPRVVAPRFPKVKEEGWWLVLGHAGARELLALRRVSFGGRTTVRLAFPKHTSGGDLVHTATLYLVSDCYLGLDQQYEVVIDAAAAEAAAKRAAALAAGGGGGWAGAAGGGGGERQEDGAEDEDEEEEEVFEDPWAHMDGGGSDDGGGGGGGEEGFWEDEPTDCR